MKFIDREGDLGSLERFWKKEESQFLVIYGKRRIGKTELIKQFIKDKPNIYFLVQKISEQENLKMLGELVGEFFGDDILKANGFDNWQILFEYLEKHLKERVVVVIDEFPYLAEANKGVSSIFQAGWDEHLKNTPVYLILCGSSIAMMESEVLAYKAPLYGRRTGQIFLQPFSFYEASEFYPNLSFGKRLELYTLAGGNPSYLGKLNPKISVEENIIEQILASGSTLYNEVEFILMEELREPRNYFTILRAIAFNKTRVSEIVNETGFEKSILHKYFFALENLRIIRKEVPVTEKNPLKSRKGIYKLQDQFFKFWFKYVLDVIERDFNLLVSENYEKVAREIVKKNEDKFFRIDKIGRWWDRNEEIDIVALNENENKILFGEVKWSNKPVGTNIYDDLKKKVKNVQWGRQDREEYFCLFSKSGFTEDMRKIAKRENVVLFHEDKLIN